MLVKCYIKPGQVANTRYVPMLQIVLSSLILDTLHYRELELLLITNYSDLQPMQQI